MPPLKEEGQTANMANNLSEDEDDVCPQVNQDKK